MNGSFQKNRLAPDVLSTHLRRARDGDLCFRACRGRGCNSGHRGRAVNICSIMQADGFRGAPRTCTPIVVSTTNTPAFGTAGACGRSWPWRSRWSTRTGRPRRGTWSTWGHGVRGTDRAHRCSGHHRADWAIRPRGAEWAGGTQRRHGIPRGTRTRGRDGLRWYQWISGSYWTRGCDRVRRTGRPDGLRRV